MVLGAGRERLEHLVMVFGEIMCSKLTEPAVLARLVAIVKSMSSDAEVGPAFKSAYDSKLSQDAKKNIEKALSGGQ